MTDELGEQRHRPVIEGVTKSDERVATQVASPPARDEEVGMLRQQRSVIESQQFVEVDISGSPGGPLNQPLAGRASFDAIVAPVDPIFDCLPKPVRDQSRRL